MDRKAYERGCHGRPATVQNTRCIAMIMSFYHYKFKFPFPYDAAPHYVLVSHPMSV
jgi:hypothetical protein